MKTYTEKELISICACIVRRLIMNKEWIDLSNIDEIKKVVSDIVPFIENRKKLVSNIIKECLLKNNVKEFKEKEKYDYIFSEIFEELVEHVSWSEEVLEKKCIKLLSNILSDK